MNIAINKVRSFSADFGGTNLYKPLKYATEEISTKLDKRIFMLTDGEADDKKYVKDIAARCPENT